MAQAEIGSAPFLLGILVCILRRDGQSQKQRARVPAPHVPAPSQATRGRVKCGLGSTRPAAYRTFWARTFLRANWFAGELFFPDDLGFFVESVLFAGCAGEVAERDRRRADGTELPEWALTFGVRVVGM